MRSRSHLNALVAIVSVFAVISTAHAGPVILQHLGTNDPTTEGFNEVLSGGATGGSAVGGAWRMVDDSATGRHNYQFDSGTDTGPAGSSLDEEMTAGQIVQYQNTGWTLTYTLDPIVEDTELGLRAIYVTFALNYGGVLKRYDMRHDLNGSGNLVVDIGGGGADFTLTGTGAHTISLVNSGGNDPDFEVFGDFVSQGTFSPFNSDTVFLFGSIHDGGTSTVDWSYVVFALPEPTSLSLLGLSVLCLGRRRR